MAYTSVSRPDQPQAEPPAKTKTEVMEPRGSATELGPATVKPKGEQKRLVVGKAKPLAPSRSGLNPLSVIGLDERVRIRETELPPFRLICSLQISAPWGDFIGTAWFAGPKTLITAGHCVFDDRQMGGWADKITIWPGRDGDEIVDGPIESTRLASVERWTEAHEPDHDIGVIHLDDDALNGRSPFKVATLSDDDFSKRLVNVSGYPADKGGLEQWWAKNRVRAVKPLRVFYDIDTAGGQSGGPVYVLDKAGDVPAVVAVHAYGTSGTPDDLPIEVNSAPRITKDKLDQIRAWVEEDSPGFLKSA